MPHLRLKRALGMVLAGTLLMVSAPARAQATDPFAVPGIAVDVTARTTLEAREQALLDGQRRALRGLLERLTLVDDHGRLPTLSDGELVQAVRDVAIENERSSAVRYIATLNVRFKPDEVRRLLRGANIPFAEWRGRPLLVLPVFVGAGQPPVLWDDPNPWRDAWAARPSGGFVPMLVPFAELADLATIGADQALAGDEAALAAIAGRHGAQDVLIATAVMAEAMDVGQPPQVDVSVFGYGHAMPTMPEAATYVGRAGESLGQVLARAANDFAGAVEDAYKRRGMLQFDRPASLSALVPLDGLETWIDVRGRLARVAMVRGYDIVSLNRKEAALVLQFVGDPQQLQTALAQSGLQLVWGEGFWVMQAAAQPAAAGPR